MATIKGTNLLFDKKRKPVLPRPADAGQVSSLQPAGEQLVALLDWEISGISGHLLDLGWLLVFIDPGKLGCRTPTNPKHPAD